MLLVESIHYLDSPPTRPSSSSSSIKATNASFPAFTASTVDFRSRRSVPEVSPPVVAIVCVRASFLLHSVSQRRNVGEKGRGNICCSVKRILESSHHANRVSSSLSHHAIPPTTTTPSHKNAPPHPHRNKSHHQRPRSLRRCENAP
ncbi:hypothetical protein EX30DRAFT_92587 [Ascodesmis nigricans]|uniref:Uncharacterized protein n=1 Tax=Ascodesmis nigricans TaxID=341454 RepID=A0A4S2N3P3_9PEZI|nr:hypothetical protein EX30DRAFT_92587 [Ascodesmis nigricans]